MHNVSDQVNDDASSSEKPAMPEWLQKYIGDVEAVDGPEQFKEIVKKLPRFEMLLGFPSGQVCE